MQFALNSFYYPLSPFGNIYLQSPYLYCVDFVNPNQNQQKSPIQQNIQFQKKDINVSQNQHNQMHLQYENQQDSIQKKLDKKNNSKIIGQKIGRKNNFECEQSSNYFTKKRRQNQKRNVMPNLIHQILTYLWRENKSGKLVKKLLNLLGNNKTTSKRYYFFLKLIRQQINRYVNLKTLIKAVKPLSLAKETIISQNQQQIYCSIIRRIITYFIKNQAPSVTIHSLKIRKENRIFHFQAQRQILNSFKIKNQHQNI